MKRATPNAANANAGTTARAICLRRMTVNVGPIPYECQLVRGWLYLKGEKALGLCDSDELIIRIADALPPAKRRQTFFHELAHAWKNEFDLSDARSVGPELMADVVALGMMTLNARTLDAIERFCAGDDAGGAR